MNEPAPLHAHAQSRDRHTDSSIKGNRAPVAQATVNAERTKGWFTNVLLATTLIALVIVSAELYSARKDLQTQVWLRDDALTKFMSGPYADLRAEVKATQIVLASQCTKPKETQK